VEGNAERLEELDRRFRDDVNIVRETYDPAAASHFHKRTGALVLVRDPNLDHQHDGDPTRKVGGSATATGDRW
jgi:hypothetical protein